MGFWGSRLCSLLTCKEQQERYRSAIQGNMCNTITSGCQKEVQQKQKETIEHTLYISIKQDFQNDLPWTFLSESMLEIVKKPLSRMVDIEMFWIYETKNMLTFLFFSCFM